MSHDLPSRSWLHVCCCHVMAAATAAGVLCCKGMAAAAINSMYIRALLFTPILIFTS